MAAAFPFISWEGSVGFTTIANSDGLVLTAWRSKMNSCWDLQGHLVGVKQNSTAVSNPTLHSADWKATASATPRWARETPTETLALMHYN